MKKIKTIISIVMTLAAALITPSFSMAMESSKYRMECSVLNASSNTYTANGKRVYDSVAEALVGQGYGGYYSVQAGFFNEYFLMPTMTCIPTATCTPIREFGGEILDENFVYAAPNPMRGKEGKIYFDLAMPAEVELKIYTPQGNFVLSQHWDSLPAGKNKWIWNTANMANGVYLLRIKARNGDGKTTVIIKKIALVK